MSLSWSSFKYLLLFALICVSGNALLISSPLYIKSFNIILASVCFVLSCFNKIIFIQYLKYIFPYILLFATQALIIFDFRVSSIIFILLKMFSGIVIYNYLKDEFAYKYINIIYIISLISLVLFSYNCLYGLIPGGIQTKDSTTSFFIYSQIYNLDYTFIYRNSGMFWEPGAFAGFLNFALLFSFTLPHERTAKIRNKIIVIILALLTTVSTTGYIVFFIISLYYLYQNRWLGKYLKYLLLILITFLVSYLFFSLDFLYEKISGNSENATRIVAYINYKDLLLDHFFLGRSYITGIIGEESGNGFLSHIIYVGIFGALYYYICLWYTLIKNSHSIIFSIFFIFTYILILQGEEFLVYPFFLALPFLHFKKSKSFSQC